MEYQELAGLDLRGKTVVLRVDFNSPVDVTGAPTLTDTSRIDDHLKTTVVPLLSSDRPPSRIVLLAHQGRRGQKDCTTLRIHFEHCRKELRPEGIKTFYVWEEYDDDDVLRMGENALAGPEVLERIRRLRERSVLLLENVRFSAAEEAAVSDEIESATQAPLIQMLGKVENVVFALDGFSVAHRAQASVIGLASLGPVYAGPVVVREIDQLSKALQSPEEPMVLVVGGGKVDDSLQSTERFLSDGRAHRVLSGGLVGMAFLLAEGVTLNHATLENLRRSTRDLETTKQQCRELLRKFRTDIYMPSDVAYAAGLHRRNAPLNRTCTADVVTEPFGDIGIQTIGRYVGELSRAKTIVMNGPMGRYEQVPMMLGTKEVLRYAALVARESRALALIGGGDTSAALEGVENADCVRQCSSGKAFLEVLASGTVESLVGVRTMQRKDRSNDRLRIVS